MQNEDRVEHSSISAVPIMQGMDSLSKKGEQLLKADILKKAGICVYGVDLVVMPCKLLCLVGMRGDFCV